jgi:hypothetical protein
VPVGTYDDGDPARASLTDPHDAAAIHPVQPSGVVFVAWWAGAAFAQVNADVLASRVTLPGPSAYVSAGVGVSTGNVDSFSTAGDGAVQFLTLFDEPVGPPRFFRDRALVYATGKHTLFDDEIVESSALLHARYTRMWIPRLGTEWFGQLQANRFQRLARRMLAGGGVRVDAVHAEEVGIWLGLGAMLEDELLSEGQHTRAVRATSYLGFRWALVKDHLTWTGTGYLQPRVDRPHDLRVLVESALDAHVDERLSLGARLTVTHDTRPPAEVEAMDVRLDTTLKVVVGRRDAG